MRDRSAASCRAAWTTADHGPLVRGAPTLLFVPQGTLGGASFFLFTANEKEDQSGDIASVNWDLLWALQAKLVLTL
jgi:hypothetical protein